MIRDFSSNLEVYTKIIFFLLLSNQLLSQILPSQHGFIKNKNSPSQINYSLSFDLNDYILTNASAVTTAWSAELWYKRTGNNSAINFTNNALNNVAGHWSLRLGQWNNKNKLGITKYSGASGSGDFYVNSSTTIGAWEHVAWTYQDNVVTIYKNGISQGTLNQTGAQLMWKYIGKSGNSIYGEVDEIRFWDDKRTATEIKDNMFNELSGNESNLIAYYKMTDESGNTVSDNSSNSNNGTITGASWVTSNAPIGIIISSYQNDVESIWSSTGTSDSEDSNGLKMSVSSTLAEANFVIFGNNNDDSGTTSSDISGISLRSKREWHLDETGTVSADVKVDIGDATGHTGTISAASNYKLLYATCGGCTFVELETGDSVSGDVVTFSSVAIKDGIYAIASADSNL